MKKVNNGFSLIEVLVTVAIIAIMSTLLLPSVIGRLYSSKVIAVKSDLSTLNLALDMYKLDNGRYPTTAQGLNALLIQPNNTPHWHTHGYIRGLPIDPFGNSYVYNNASENITIYSRGADGHNGGTGENIDIYLD